MAWQGRVDPGARNGLDCCLAALAIRVRAYDVAREVRWVGTVVQIGAGTWLISLELAAP
jgi:hypothetical protein